MEEEFKQTIKISYNVYRVCFVYCTHLKISSQLYTNSKKGGGSILTNKGVTLAILTLHYGSKLTNKGSFFTFFVENNPCISQL